MKVGFIKFSRGALRQLFGHSANQHRFGNIVSASRVVAIVSPESAPIKRIPLPMHRGQLIDATYGRRTGYYRFQPRHSLGDSAETASLRD